MFLAGACNEDAAQPTRPSVLSGLVWTIATAGGELHVYELAVDSEGGMTYGRRSAVASREDFNQLAELAVAPSLMEALKDPTPCPTVVLDGTATLAVTPAGASTASKAVTGCVFDANGRLAPSPPFVDIVDALNALLVRYFP